MRAHPAAGGLRPDRPTLTCRPAFLGRPSRVMSQLVTHRTQPLGRADTARERVRLWSAQGAFAAAWAATAIGCAWMAVHLGAGALGAAATLAAGLAPLAL